MKSYTYLIKHKPTNTVYYGVRTANKLSPEQDLWNEYYTSSKQIHAMIAADGIDSFDVEIRREFETPEAATQWETKVLQRCKVMEDSRWLNANVAGHILATPAVRAKISAYHTGRAKSEEHKHKISAANRGKVKGPISDTQRTLLSKIKSGSGNAMYGKKHSEETLAKMSKARLAQEANREIKRVGNNWTEKERQAHSEKMSGRKQDPEIIARRSETMRAKKMKRERLVCPHCEKDVAVNIYARYHGEKCKNKVDFS